jgi:hypothetical protein
VEPDASLQFGSSIPALTRLTKGFI